MDNTIKRHLVISAVNIRKGGTLTVLCDCLRYLSSQDGFRVTALVHDRSLCDYPGIEYIVIPWSTKSWLHRLWCEYHTMGKISKQLAPVDLWFSLHDTTPRVEASRQAVYCHNSFPLLTISWKDFKMNYKIPLFSLLSKYAYRFNVNKNNYLVVQQEWMRVALSYLIPFPAQKIIVSPPAFLQPVLEDRSKKEPIPIFIYPAIPDVHKNIETLCFASRLIEFRLGKGRFRTLITVDGSENKYARWLRTRFGQVPSIEFCGRLDQKELFSYYERAACLVFPSRVETWGLPISEFLPTGKPMILADRPYARETAAGASSVAFFLYNDAYTLSLRMQDVIEGRTHAFSSVRPRHPKAPYAQDWQQLFQMLINQ